MKEGWQRDDVREWVGKARQSLLQWVEIIHADGRQTIVKLLSTVRLHTSIHTHTRMCTTVTRDFAASMSAAKYSVNNAELELRFMSHSTQNRLFHFSWLNTEYKYIENFQSAAIHNQPTALIKLPVIVTAHVSRDEKFTMNAGGMSSKPGNNAFRKCLSAQQQTYCHVSDE